MSPGDRSDLQTCAEQVRRHDHDRYLTALFAPGSARQHLIALYAFNLEVAKIPEVVSEPMLGQIRLQWWRESIEGIYAGHPRRHEVVTPLAQAVEACGLTRAHFDRLIDAREADLASDPLGSLEELEAYAEATSSTLVWLVLEILGATDRPAQEAGRHLGVAWALTGLLRALPFHARARRCYLPGDLCRRAGLSLADLYRLQSTPALATVVQEVAALANEHLLQLRDRASALPAATRPALLPACLAARYLVLLEKTGHDPFDARFQAVQGGKAWRLLWCWVTGRL